MVKTARTHGSGAPNPGVMRSSMFRSNPMRVIARAAMAEVFIPVSPHREISRAPVGVHRNSMRGVGSESTYSSPVANDVSATPRLRGFTISPMSRAAKVNTSTRNSVEWKNCANVRVCQNEYQPKMLISHEEMSM